MPYRCYSADDLELNLRHSRKSFNTRHLRKVAEVIKALLPVVYDYIEGSYDLGDFRNCKWSQVGLGELNLSTAKLTKKFSQ
jgi:hypothetical protein